MNAQLGKEKAALKATASHRDFAIDAIMQDLDISRIH
jgi:hypothetical protein